MPLSSNCSQHGFLQIRIYSILCHEFGINVISTMDLLWDVKHFCCAETVLGKSHSWYWTRIIKINKLVSDSSTRIAMVRRTYNPNHDIIRIRNQRRRSNAITGNPRHISTTVVSHLRTSLSLAPSADVIK